MYSFVGKMLNVAAKVSILQMLSAKAISAHALGQVSNVSN